MTFKIKSTTVIADTQEPTVPPPTITTEKLVVECTVPFQWIVVCSIKLKLNIIIISSVAIVNQQGLWYLPLYEHGLCRLALATKEEAQTILLMFSGMTLLLIFKLLTLKALRTPFHRSSYRQRIESRWCFLCTDGVGWITTGNQALLHTASQRIRIRLFISMERKESYTQWINKHIFIHSSWKEST